MSKYKNKYFKKLKYKSSCTENLLYRMAGDHREKQWRKQRKKYGGWDERATWNLNTFMTEQIYTWLKMYYEKSNVDLSFYKFQINGIEMTQENAILLALKDMEFYLQHSEDWGEDISQKRNNKIAEAYYILGIIFPALWW